MRYTTSIPKKTVERNKIDIFPVPNMLKEEFLAQSRRRGGCAFAKSSLWFVSGREMLYIEDYDEPHRLPRLHSLVLSLDITRKMCGECKRYGTGKAGEIW